MESKVAARRRYTNQRGRRTPPHVSIKVARQIAGWSLDELADRIEEATGDRPTRGALSAIENGVRGASREMLSAFEAAYGVTSGSITTDYEPRATPALDSDEVA
ncbi:MAG: helix-turn-helix transcriptional regulator [Gordonia sp. (in: high G+C Gram-positive bacteria)]|uniref:helix-turn-helix domain-containing protein n=1 Tax=Gordonia sp. (in: high G+C Gram-positive bacteria) TaxID=84139 RepID=UPI003C78BECA